jgi:hypothetical protein
VLLHESHFIFLKKASRRPGVSFIFDQTGRHSGKRPGCPLSLIFLCRLLNADS